MDVNAIEKELTRRVEERITKLSACILDLVIEEFNITDRHSFSYRSKYDEYEAYYSSISEWKRDLSLSFRRQFLEQEVKKEVKKLLNKIDLFDDK
tara:strand:+ start:869 stop:1153 length:285 start_codon:yes stop_codon:yes gene_type:complete